MDTIDELKNEIQDLRGDIQTAHEAARGNADLVTRLLSRTESLLHRLEEASTEHRAVLDAASKVCIIAADQEGAIRIFNKGAEQMLGYKAEEVVGQLSPAEFHVQGELIARTREVSRRLGRPVDGVGFFFELAKSGKAREQEFAWIRKDGSRFPVRMSVTPLKDSRGAMKGFLVAAMDITDRKQAELEILDAMQAAEDANKVKSTFLANMSHELRTPLNAIIGYSEMLQEDAQDAGNDVFVKDLKKIQAAGKHLLSLINDVLDLSKIEAGKMDIYVEEFDPAEMVSDVVATVQPLVDKKANALKVECPKDLGKIRADLTRTRQILFNLMSNAGKFTENGTITLKAGRLRDGETEYIDFSVADTGIGMTPEQLGKMFQAFSQADASTTRKFGGTGLGLAISKKFCEMMGGDIKVESESGKGTVFTARIPVLVGGRPQEEAPTKPSSDAEPEGPPVLIIDDDPAVPDMLGRMLAKDGVRTVSASTGDEGLRLARELKPSVITLDVLMPGKDGWAVLRELKEDPELASIPVIMITMVDEKGMGGALGAADYLIKPVECDRLVALVRQHAGESPVEPVLVVDDDERIRNLMEHALKKAGWPVWTAENGRAALERLSEGVPSVILLDLMMPEMNGFEFLEELGRREEWRSIPVVVVTAKELTDAERESLNGLVAKVIEKEKRSRPELLQEVRDQVFKHIRRD